MLRSVLPHLVVDAVVTIARTIDEAVETRSIQNAREALVQRRQGRRLRTILGGGDDFTDTDPEAFPPAAAG